MSYSETPPQTQNFLGPDSSDCCARRNPDDVLGAKIYAAFSCKLSDDAANGMVPGIGPFVFKCGSAGGRACSHVPIRLNTDRPNANKGAGSPKYAGKDDWFIIWCRPARYLHIDRLEFLPWLLKVGGVQQVDYKFATAAQRGGSHLATELVVMSPSFLESGVTPVSPDPLFVEMLAVVRAYMLQTVVSRLSLTSLDRTTQAKS